MVGHRDTCLSSLHSGGCCKRILVPAQTRYIVRACMKRWRAGSGFSVLLQSVPPALLNWSGMATFYIILLFKNQIKSSWKIFVTSMLQVLHPILVTGSELGLCSHKQRCHWAAPPHPTCVPWSKSWWLCSLSKARFIFSYIQGSQYNVAPPAGAYVSFIFFQVLSFSVYMTSDCALCPSFLGNFMGPCRMCARHCSSRRHSWQLQSWWVPSIFYSNISASTLTSTPSSPLFS